MKKALCVIAIILALVGIIMPYVTFAIKAFQLELAFLGAVCGVSGFLIATYLARDS